MIRAAKEDILRGADEMDKAWLRKDSGERRQLESYSVVVCGLQPSKWHDSDTSENQPRILSSGKRPSGAFSVPGNITVR